MHLPTPTLHSKKDETKKQKRQKRKASDASTSTTTTTTTTGNAKPASKKLTKTKPSEGADTALSRRATRGSKRSPVHTMPGTGGAVVPARASAENATSADASLRRSSRIKESVRKCNETWHRCRPYVERLNGTIMPLEHQGSEAYYQKDGVRI